MRLQKNGCLLHQKRKNKEKDKNVLLPPKITTMEQFYNQRKSKMDPINIMLSNSQKRGSSLPKSSIYSQRLPPEGKKPEIKLEKMSRDEKVEDDDLFDFNRKKGWNFILNNIITPTEEK